MFETVIVPEQEGVETEYIPGSAWVRMIAETVHPEEQ